HAEPSHLPPSWCECLDFVCAAMDWAAARKKRFQLAPTCDNRLRAKPANRHHPALNKVVGLPHRLADELGYPVLSSDAPNQIAGKLGLARPLPQFHPLTHAFTQWKQRRYWPAYQHMRRIPRWSESLPPCRVYVASMSRGDAGTFRKPL